MMLRRYAIPTTGMATGDGGSTKNTPPQEQESYLVTKCAICHKSRHDYEMCESCGQCLRCCPKDCKGRPPKPSLLDEVQTAIGKRHESYDAPERNFTRIADIWSAILNVHITPEQVALMMVGVKLAREAYSHQHDNLVDLIGYTLCLEEILNAHPAEETGR